MAVLTTKQRNNLPKKEFGIPGQRAYPMPDRAHAANAKARAAQSKKLTPAERKHIVNMANTILGSKGKA